MLHTDSAAFLKIAKTSKGLKSIFSTVSWKCAQLVIMSWGLLQVQQSRRLRSVAHSFSAFQLVISQREIIDAITHFSAQVLQSNQRTRCMLGEFPELHWLKETIRWVNNVSWAEVTVSLITYNDFVWLSCTCCCYRDQVCQDTLGKEMLYLTVRRYLEVEAWQLNLFSVSSKCFTV